jgi:AbrB family looped-hinge helix DNA binding protein
MTTKLSSNGQVVLPLSARRKLGLAVGASLEVKVEDGRILLVPERARPRKARIVSDPVSGLPVLAVAGSALQLTGRQVAEIMADLP